MAVIDHIDGENRDVYLHADTVGVDVHPIDIYKEMRTLRRTDESLRNFDLFLQAKGHDKKKEGKYTERYVVCLDGTRIIPYDTSHTLTITGVIITDDGQEGISCFDRTPLTPSTLVDINYQPLQVEVIYVGGTPDDVAAAVLGNSLTDYQHNPASLAKATIRGAYEKKIAVNINEGFSGQVFPVGMKFKPVNNTTDMFVLLAEYELSAVCIGGDVVMPASANLNDLSFCAGGSIDRTVTIPNTATTNGTQFDNIHIDGFLTGRTEITNSVIDEVYGFRGALHDSVIETGLVMDGTTGQTTHIHNCEGCAGSYLDLGDAKLHIDGLANQLELRGKTGSSFLGVTLRGAIVTIDPTCVAGEILFTGEGTVIDNSGAGCTVDTSRLISLPNIAEAVMSYERL